MEYARIMRDGIHLFMGKAGSVVVGLLNTVILARILSTEDMGKYSLFYMVVNLAVMMAFSWSDNSIVRHGREEFVLNKKINKSFWARFYLLFPLILLFTVALFILRNQISTYIGIETKYIFLIVTLFLFNGVVNTLISVFQSIDQMKISSYILMIQRTLFLAGLGAMFFGLINSNLPLVFLSLNLSFLISMVFFAVMLNRSHLFPYHFDRSYFKKIWDYSWPQFIGFSGLYIVDYVDLYVIRKYMTLADVGVYSVAYKGFDVLTGLLISVNTLFLPLIVEYKTKKRHDHITSYARKIPLFALLWSVLVGIGLLLSSFFIPIIFSSKYVASIPSFNILLITSIFYFCSVSMLPLVNAFDLIIYSQLINIVKALLNIVLDFTLVPRVGIIGAAYGTLISYAVAVLLSIAVIIAHKKLIFGGFPHDNKSHGD